MSELTDDDNNRFTGGMWPGVIRDKLGRLKSGSVQMEKRMERMRRAKEALARGDEAEYDRLMWEDAD